MQSEQLDRGRGLMMLHSGLIANVKLHFQILVLPHSSTKMRLSESYLFMSDYEACSILVMFPETIPIQKYCIVVQKWHIIFCSRSLQRVLQITTMAAITVLDPQSSEQNTFTKLCFFWSIVQISLLNFLPFMRLSRMMINDV